MTGDRLLPLSRKSFVAGLKKFGFEGPFVGGRHEFVVKGHTRLVLPNPHRSEISVALPSRLLVPAGITRSEWAKKMS
ncbi:MAG: type II toxin-antitoxin system HicA family toxin, partial [Desulfomonilaceae bacterium]